VSELLVALAVVELVETLEWQHPEPLILAAAAGALGMKPDRKPAVMVDRAL
jgi:hypothetical protein